MPYTDDPENVPADRVRFLLGDTGSSPDLSDNEIYFLLNEAGDDPLQAAARGAELAAAKFSSDVEERRVGPLHVKRLIGKARKYQLLASQLWARITGGTGAPFAGGISRADKTARRLDGDRVRPAFSRRMMGYGAGRFGGSGNSTWEERHGE